MDVNDLCWHDGNITKVEILPNFGESSTIKMLVDLYENYETAKTRDPISLICFRVKRFNISCDLIELNDHSGPGSIGSGYVQGKIFRLHLCGGFIEIEAEAYEVEKC